MRCSCNTCMYPLQHEEGLICGKKLYFVEPKSNCNEWDTDKFFDPTKLMVAACVVILITFILGFVIC